MISKGVTVRDTPVTPVAAIAMGCRLPEGIGSPELLWEAVLRGDDLQQLDGKVTR
jgi:polyketide synthase 5